MAQREKYFNYLKKIGFLIKYEDLELYHGRCESEGESWQVRTDVDNSSNVTRDNIMAIPCLCVASYDVAKSYASGTSLGGRNGKMKVYKVVCLDNETFIINESFDVNKLSEKDVVKLYQVMLGLTQEVLKAYCDKIENGRQFLNEVSIYLNLSNYIYKEDEEKIIDNFDEKGFVDKSALRKICSALNTKQTFIKNPTQATSTFVFGKEDERTTGIDKNKKFSLNQEFVSLFMKKNNIIGLKKKNRYGFKNDIVYLFDLSKIQAYEDNIDLEK